MPESLEAGVVVPNTHVHGSSMGFGYFQWVYRINGNHYKTRYGQRQRIQG